MVLTVAEGDFRAVKKVGDLLKEYLQGEGVAGGKPVRAALRGMEAGSPASALAAHSRLVDVQNGILLVEVDHPGWLQMLQLRKAALLEAARRAAPRRQRGGHQGRARRAANGRRH